MNQLIHQSVIRRIEQEGSMRTSNKIQDNYGVCPRAYRGCIHARDKEDFERICSQPHEYDGCILRRDSGIIKIRGGQR